MFSAPQIAWHGAGCPTPDYDITEHHGHCATCGTQIDGDAIHIKWAYTATHNLPYLRIYDHATYDRNRQRSEIALSSTQNRRLHAQGEFQAWQMCYPAEFQAWCDRWPELAYS